MFQDQIRDKLRPIVVVVNYNIKHHRNKRQAQRITLGPLAPVLNALPPNTQRTEVRLYGVVLSDAWLIGQAKENLGPVSLNPIIFSAVVDTIH